MVEHTMMPLIKNILCIILVFLLSGCANMASRMFGNEPSTEEKIKATAIDIITSPIQAPFIVAVAVGETKKAITTGKHRERRKYCLDIVSGVIPIRSIIDKGLITNEELSCLADAIDKQKEIDQNNLNELLKLTLPVRGFSNLLNHENADNDIKKKAVNKILFSDRKNFEGGNPLLEKIDRKERRRRNIEKVGYHPFITESLLYENALLLDTNPEWYNSKECIDFVFNIVRVEITSAKLLDFIVEKVNEALSRYVDGKESVFMRQDINYLLRDIYLHDNISKNTRIKMLNFYKGVVDTEKKRKLVALLNGVLINEVCTVYWAKDEEIVDLIRFVIEKNKDGAGIGYVNGGSYYTGGRYLKNLPYSGIEYSKIISKNILPAEVLVELAKQNPSTTYHSLPNINDKKDLSEIKISIEREIKSLKLEVDNLTRIAELSTAQKNKLSWLGNAIKSYSALLSQIEQKIDSI